MMNRRLFLTAFSAGLGASHWRPSHAAAFAGSEPSRIVDTHTHFYDPSRPQGVPWPSKSEPVLYRTTLPARFLEVASPHGVRETVVVEASAWVEDNQWLLDLARDEPAILAIVGNLNPGTPDFAKHLARFAKNPLFRGIRMRRLIAEGQPESGPAFTALMDDLRRLSDAGLSLDLLGGPEMFAPLARLNDRLPELRVVIDHMPFARRDDSIRLLRNRPAIYAKVSSVPRRHEGKVRTDLAFFRPALDEIWEVFGEQRVIYGSNWPVSDLQAPYEAGLAIVKEYFAGHGPQALESYFWKNAAAAYRWKPRA